MQPLRQRNIQLYPASTITAVRHAPGSRSVLAGLLSLLVATSGCGHSSDHVQALTPVTTVPPSTWNAGSMTWQQCPGISETDQRLLTEFFQRHPAFSGSPEFAGDPVCFSSGTANRRFIWLQATPNGTAWNCIDFVAGRFLTSNGEGIPWQS